VVHLHKLSLKAGEDDGGGGKMNKRINLHTICSRLNGRYNAAERGRAIKKEKYKSNIR
jgi:hypothetical protein